MHRLLLTMIAVAGLVAAEPATEEAAEARPQMAKTVLIDGANHAVELWIESKGEKDASPLIIYVAGEEFVLALREPDVSFEGRITAQDGGKLLLRYILETKDGRWAASVIVAPNALVPLATAGGTTYQVKIQQM